MRSRVRPSAGATRRCPARPLKSSRRAARRGVWADPEGERAGDPGRSARVVAGDVHHDAVHHGHVQWTAPPLKRKRAVARHGAPRRPDAARPGHDPAVAGVIAGIAPALPTEEEQAAVGVLLGGDRQPVGNRLAHGVVDARHLEGAGVVQVGGLQQDGSAATAQPGQQGSQVRRERVATLRPALGGHPALVAGRDQNGDRGRQGGRLQQQLASLAQRRQADPDERDRRRPQYQHVALHAVGAVVALIGDPGQERGPGDDREQDGAGTVAPHPEGHQGQQECRDHRAQQQVAVVSKVEARQVVELARRQHPARDHPGCEVVFREPLVGLLDDRWWPPGPSTGRCGTAPPA